MTADGVRLTLLYIEDNASNVQLVKRIFRDRDDVDLRTALRGKEGIEIARADQPGLILLDLHLPDMPGAEVLSALRADPLTAAIPVVAVSADATRDQIANLHAGGVVDYVTKPFQVSRLLGVVDSFIEDEADVVLDHARVKELFDLDSDGTTFHAIAASALQEAATQIAAIAGKDAASVSAAAHSLKSSAAIVGATRLAALADDVEHAARAGSLPDAITISELQRTLTETEQATIDAGGAG